MIYKEFPRALSPITLNTKGSAFVGLYRVLKDEINTVMAISKDGKTIGLRINYEISIEWQNGSALNYDRHAIVELQRGEVKPAFTFIVNIVKDNMIELHSQFEEHPEFPKFNLPKTQVVFSSHNFITVKKMWEHFEN
jgi:hypothetical protein